MMKFLLGLFDHIEGWERKHAETKITIYPDMVGAMLFMVFSTSMLVLMPTQIKVTEGGPINARTFPGLLLWGMLVLSSVIFLVDLGRIVFHKPCAKIEVALVVEVRALTILTMLVLYLALLRPLGFIASSCLFSVFMTGFFRVRKLSYYLIGMACAIVIGFIFQAVLHVRLP